MSVAETVHEPFFNTAKAEAFAEKAMETINGGCLALMTSIGHRTGIFDVMKNMSPSTSRQVADAADLDERYVREWLGAMVVGGVIETDPDAGTFQLPAEHAAFLTRDAAPDNIAAFTQYVGLLGSVEDAIVECFRQGGGVPYSAFPRFQEVMAEDSGQTVLPALFDHILPLAPGLVERLEAGIDVLDVGCGAGRALAMMAESYPASRFVGYDFSEHGVAMAQANADEMGLTNLSFEVRDVTNLGDEKRFDLITTFDAIHDQAEPARVLSEIRKALRDDGVYLMQDIAGSCHMHNNVNHPMGPFLYTVSTMHCMTVSLAQGGAGLGTMWGEETAVEMLGEAGFGNVDVSHLAHDQQNAYYVSTI